MSRQVTSCHVMSRPVTSCHVGCSEGCRFHTASAVYHLVINKSIIITISWSSVDPIWESAEMELGVGFHQFTWNNRLTVDPPWKKGLVSTLIIIMTYQTFSATEAHWDPFRIPHLQNKLSRWPTKFCHLMPPTVVLRNCPTTRPLEFHFQSTGFIFHTIFNCNEFITWNFKLSLESTG